jgi:lysophospholipase L1-like esterase
MDFLKKIFSPAILTISFFFLIYIFYKSEIYWHGEDRDYYFTYYIFSLILIFFSIVSFYINQNIKEYLIILGISILVGIYLFEGYLTFKEQPPKELFLKQQLYEKKTGNKWDKRSKYEVYKDLKKMNKEIAVNVAPKYFLKDSHNIFPLSGISNAETIYCNENGYYSIYQSDRYGFNNPDKEWDNKETEYLIVGDSFTDGACVNRPNDIASVLRTLSNKSVLNLGYNGNGPLLEYATLKEFLNPNTKKVIWNYYEGNDFYNLEFEKKSKILLNYLNNINFNQNLKLRQNEVDILTRQKINKTINDVITIIDILKILKLEKIRTALSIYLPKNQQPVYKEPSKAAIKVFKKILNLAAKNNSKLYFVYLPEYSRYKKNFDNTNYNLVKDIVIKMNIPFIDINKEVFEKEQNPLKLFPFELSGHYNIEGYKKVAETIYKFTKD